MEEIALELTNISASMDAIQKIEKQTKEYWKGELGAHFREIMQVELQDGRKAEKRLYSYVEKLESLTKEKSELEKLPMDWFE